MSGRLHLSGIHGNLPETTDKQTGHRARFISNLIFYTSASSV